MKKAIVVASFGCSIKTAREKYIYPIEDAIRNTYKAVDFFRVFTSEIIRKKMKREENIDIDNMDICLQKLKEQKYTHIYISVTHIIPGFEYEKIIRAVNKYKGDFEEIRVARTFLDEQIGNEEINVIKSYIKTDLASNETVVLVGHGSGHSSNKYYKVLEGLLRKHINNSYIINVEGTPCIDDIIDELKEKEYKKIYLYPLLIVSGDHALNDIGSDDEESIKSILSQNGFNVDMFFTGLGENKQAIKLFVDRLNEITN